MTIDHASNEAFYGRPGVLASEVIRSDAPAAPAPAPEFIAAIQRSATGATASNSAPRTTSATAPTPTSTAPQPAQPGSLTTYPMEDQHPGEEPPE